MVSMRVRVVLVTKEVTLKRRNLADTIFEGSNNLGATDFDDHDWILKGKAADDVQKFQNTRRVNLVSTDSTCCHDGAVCAIVVSHKVTTKTSISGLYTSSHGEYTHTKFPRLDSVVLTVENRPSRGTEVNPIGFSSFACRWELSLSTSSTVSASSGLHIRLAQVSLMRVTGTLLT